MAARGVVAESLSRQRRHGGVQRTEAADEDLRELKEAVAVANHTAAAAKGQLARCRAELQTAQAENHQVTTLNPSGLPLVSN